MGHLIIEPHHALFSESDGCPSCGSQNLHRRGVTVTKTRKYQKLHCQDCGAWCRARKAEPVELKLVA
jgi:transcription elongation factor Elf1